MTRKIIALLLISFCTVTSVFAQKKKVAVVTFYANTVVGFEELGI